MLSTPLILKHASANRPSGQWNDDDYDVLAGSGAASTRRDLADITPQYWQFWIGLILVVIVMAGPERLTERAASLWSGSLARLLGRLRQPKAGPAGET